MKPLTNYLTEEQAVACVGKGWEPLVRRVYNAKIGIGTPVGIIQVKEKWGGLRIYTDYYDEQLEPIITEVGNQSYKICETCGAPADLVQKGTWYQTRCEEHRGEGVPVEN
jgi:hypothetical protein